MTCREFEQAWNELLDALASASVDRTGSPGADVAISEAQRALACHAEVCAGCDRLNTRYQVLRRAIEAPRSAAPGVSAGFAERILAEVERPRPSAWSVPRATGRRYRRPLMVAAASIIAAAVIAGVFVAGNHRDLSGRRQVVRSAASSGAATGHHVGAEMAVAESRGLNQAVAEATAATLELARSASEPAARISRQMLDAATGPAADVRAETIGATVSVPSLDSLTPGTAAGAMLQQVGDRLATGVRPLSNTARRAFGFLLGPDRPKPEVPMHPQTQKGA